MRQLACVLITLLVGLCFSQKYEVNERMRLTTEYRNMADSDLLREYANLLLSGPENERKLVSIAASGEGKHRRAAALVLLYSGDPKFVPTLIKLADEKELSGIASEAVSINPEASWRAIIRLARGGSAGATALVHRYVNLRDDAFDELIKSKYPKVRAAAVYGLREESDVFAVLADPDWNTCRNAVKILLSRERFDKTRLYFHKIDRVRVFAAELTQRWTETDFELWARIAGDPHPDVRKWAMYKIAPIGLSWASAKGRAASIKAIADGIAKGPQRVREAAVHAVRCWFLDWGSAVKNWSPSDLAAAQKVLRSKACRDELYRQAQNVDYYNSVEHGYGIQMVLAVEALARSGDQRAATLIRSAINESSNAYRGLLRALVYVDRDIAQTQFFRMVHDAAYEPNWRTTSVFFEVFYALQNANWDIEPSKYIAIARDETIEASTRWDLVAAFPHARNKVLNSYVLSLADTANVSVLFALAIIDDPRAEAALIKLTQHESETTRLFARNALEQWRSEFKNRRK